MSIKEGDDYYGYRLFLCGVWCVSLRFLIPLAGETGRRTAVFLLPINSMNFSLRKSRKNGMMMPMKNADKIANYIAKYGINALQIYPLPNSPYWMVAQCRMKKETPEMFQVLLCKPENEKWFVVSKAMTLSNLDELYASVLALRLSTSEEETASILR